MASIETCDDLRSSKTSVETRDDLKSLDGEYRDA